jgi:small-conductance mechanosensitive channel
MNFHQVAYADRIQKITRTFAVIDALKDYRPKRKSFGMPPNSRRASGGILTMKGHASKKAVPDPQSKSKWWSRKAGPKQESHVKEKLVDHPGAHPPAKGLTDHEAQMRETDRFTAEYQKDMPQQESKRTSKVFRRNSQTTFANLAQRGASAAKIARAAMKDPISVVGKKSGLKLDVNNPAEARKLARKIYFGFKADSNRTYLIPSDFYPAFPTHELAKEAFSIFDSDGNGDISRTEVKNEIFRAYKERRALANSLQDVGHAIGRLDRIMMAMAGIVFIFIALSVVGIDYSKALTSVYTVGIAAAFIFKETAGNVFDAIIMVFCTHPYDTGDRVIMENDGVDEVLVVKRMGLLVTVFLRWDGTEWFAPNSLLGQKFIINLRRSSNQFENATVQFGWDTPLEKLDQLEEKMNLWLQTDEQRRFEPGTACVIQSLVNQQYMEITIGMTHRENWQDWGGRWNRRTAFHAALNYYTRELGITFYNSEQPVEMTNAAAFKEQLLNPSFNDDEDNDEQLGDDESDIRLDRSTRSNNHPGSFQSNQQQVDNASLINKKGPSVFTSATERLPEALGFSAPPESGTGMRKRKKISKKKAMLGDA